MLKNSISLGPLAYYDIPILEEKTLLILCGLGDKGILRPKAKCHISYKEFPNYFININKKKYKSIFRLHYLSRVFLVIL